MANQTALESMDAIERIINGECPAFDIEKYSLEQVAVARHAVSLLNAFDISTWEARQIMEHV